MKIVNAITGKIGHCVIGPKNYLNENIKLGEVALCIARDERSAKPCVWLIGGTELLVDFISLAREKGEIEEEVANLLLPRLDDAAKTKPENALSRLAAVIGIDIEELQDKAKLAQVAITAPIEGVKDFSNATPKWLSKATIHASVH